MERHVETTGLGRLHVDDQLELDRGLHGKFARISSVPRAFDALSVLREAENAIIRE
jgi:hypothetical protein